MDGLHLRARDMEHQQENQLLEQYASVVNRKIFTSQSDLDPKDRALPEMLSWCRKQECIVVLQSGAILTSQPASRIVQNCKIVMLNKGIVPGTVYPATMTLIRMLLENAEEIDEGDIEGLDFVSIQQQRLRLLVREALNVEATDIHIEVRSDLARIRFRKHGELYLHAEWLPKLAREVVSVAFNKETDHAVSHFNPLVPQNASMPLEVEDREVRLRLASLPAHDGFDVVMRILAVADEAILNLDELGYLPEQITLIKKAINLPHGAIIVAGPTGSGKTTTLSSCMRIVNNTRKIFMIEDPVEKVIQETTQVPVNTEHYDRSFASMTRTALRMDPDLIVLGEMRDEDTAAIMLRAAITGHLVFSTVHTNTSTDIITRLIDLGSPPSLLASPNLLACLICQRLVPKLCNRCARPLSESPQHLAHIARWQTLFGEHFSGLRCRGQDCPECYGLGIVGRTVVAEVIWVDAMGREFIKQGDTLGWQRYLIENGWVPYRERLLEMVRAGECDPLDGEGIVGEFTPGFGQQNFDYRAVQA